jgi:hypothetical protein
MSLRSEGFWIFFAILAAVVVLPLQGHWAGAIASTRRI